jgi:hypothetical protein
VVGCHPANADGDLGAYAPTRSTDLIGSEDSLRKEHRVASTPRNRSEARAAPLNPGTITRTGVMSCVRAAGVCVLPPSGISG